MRAGALSRSARRRAGWSFAVAGPFLIGALLSAADHPRDYIPVAWFLATVMAATVLGGPPAGFTATVLSTAGMTLVGTEPRWRLVRSWTVDVSLVAFFAIAVATVKLLASLDRARSEQ